MILKVRVIPRASKARIEPFAGGIKVYLNEPATEGKANKKLLAVLASHYGLKKRAVVIRKGLKSREKIVELEGI
ncbi:MAG: DUF167 domain-containing protein [Candidatus Omnitrophota bacterium]|jgi:hypothetical protein